MHYALRIQSSWQFPGLRRIQLAAGLFSIMPPSFGITSDIRQSGSTDAFKSKLKTYLFNLTFNQSLTSIASSVGQSQSKDPWEHLTLLDPAASHIDAYGSSYSGLHWINVLHCFTISLYLYFCKMWHLFTLIFSVLLLIIVCGLPSSRSPGGEEVVWTSTTWRCLGLLSRLLNPNSLHKLFFVSDILSM